jgi:hypothetical protein
MLIWFISENPHLPFPVAVDRTNLAALMTLVLVLPVAGIVFSFPFALPSPQETSEY